MPVTMAVMHEHGQSEHQYKKITFARQHQEVQTSDSELDGHIDVAK